MLNISIFLLPPVKKSKLPLPGTAKLTKGTVDLPLKDVYGVQIKRKRGKGQLEGEGLCLGFTVYTYYQFGPNCWKDLVIEFEHPSESLCNKYYDGIKTFIKGIKVFMMHSRMSERERERERERQTDRETERQRETERERERDRERDRQIDRDRERQRER